MKAKAAEMAKMEDNIDKLEGEDSDETTTSDDAEQSESDEESPLESRDIKLDV